ncbi:oxidation resistance protein 1 [Rhizophlyctis rosea]|uniref:Oxidation resistance protein 1 n=1 Tax=Rhizophlyctis rosea TaxID=64517 RepID=A0AAD5S4R7_9FUNG|nr:oxidation resistance protein 1 [Rhizophlyctis rosea]
MPAEAHSDQTNNSPPPTDSISSSKPVAIPPRPSELSTSPSSVLSTSFPSTAGSPPETHPSSPHAKSPPAPRRSSLSFSEAFPSSLSGFFWEILGFGAHTDPTNPSHQTSTPNLQPSTSNLSSSPPTTTNFLGSFDTESSPSPRTSMSSPPTMITNRGVPIPAGGQLVPSSESATGLTEEELFLRSLEIVPGADVGAEEEVMELVLSPFDDAARGRIRLTGRNELTEQIVTEDLAEKIRFHLPPLLRESTRWHLVYSLDQHGISLNTLYKRAQDDHGPQLLVIRDSKENVFGAFGSEFFHVRTGYYGTGACFLWKQTPEGDVKAWHATGMNDYLMLGEAHFIALGGGEGHFGLWVAEDLFHGHSGPCQTFGNEKLSSTAEFDIIGVELWGFKM